MVYNFHWVLHLRQFIEDFGPVYGFWAFLTERLNYNLKQFRNNNWGGGKLEISMMRSFSRDTAIGAFVSTFLCCSLSWVLNQCWSTSFLLWLHTRLWSRQT